MKIDLRAYTREVSHWLTAFDPFVDMSSKPAMKRLGDELQNGRDKLLDNFPWRLPAPVWTVTAGRYDGVGKTPHEVRIGWQFEMEFEKLAQTAKNQIWTVGKLVTHIRVHDASNNAEIMHYHHDLKNVGQLGPHSHLQFSEHFQKSKGKIPLAVPRFPSAALLPTDCLDLALSEFFPFEWPKSQSGSRGLTLLRNGQQKRFEQIAESLRVAWGTASRRTPIATTQECWFPDLQLA